MGGVVDKGEAIMVVAAVIGVVAAGDGVVEGVGEVLGGHEPSQDRW